MIEVRLTKCLLVLTEDEMRSLLRRDMDLWAEAVRRGKAILRAKQAKKRRPTKAQEAGFRGGTACHPRANPNDPRKDAANVRQGDGAGAPERLRNEKGARSR